MSKISEEEILRRLELLSEVQPSEQSANQAVQRVRRVLTEHKQTPKIKNISTWRIIMKSKMTKLAAAAVIIIVLGGVSFWPSGNSNKANWWSGPVSVWGQEILEKLDIIECITCREQHILVLADGSKHTSSTWDEYSVSNDSYRRNIYDSNELREIQWYVPDGNDMIQHYIRFDLECYGAVRHKGRFGTKSPIQRMRFYVGLLNKADKPLGEKIIEDRNCVGFAISASKYGNNPEHWIDHIWFDVDTKLPVLIEQHGRLVTGHPDKTYTTIQDQFDYNPELPADTFTPWIPEGFVNAHPDEVRKNQQE